MMHQQIKKKLDIVDKNDNVFYYMESINQRFCINTKGLVWDDKTKQFIYPIVNKMLAITRLPAGGPIETHKLWLCAFSPMHSEQTKWLEGIKLDYEQGKKGIDPLKFNHQNLIWKIPFGGMESDIPGYYSIPRYPEIVVTPGGLFIYHKTKKPCPITIGKKGRSSSITLDFASEDNSQHTDVCVKKLLALAFHPYPVEHMYAKVAMLNTSGNPLCLQNLKWIKTTKANDPIVPISPYLDRNTQISVIPDPEITTIRKIELTNMTHEKIGKDLYARTLPKAKMTTNTDIVDATVLRVFDK